MGNREKITREKVNGILNSALRSKKFKIKPLVQSIMLYGAESWTTNYWMQNWMFGEGSEDIKKTWNLGARKSEKFRMSNLLLLN